MAPEVESLLSRVEGALARGWSDERLLPLLVHLARHAAPASEGWRLAHRELGARLVTRTPWRASLFARALVRTCPDDPIGWGVLGLAQSLLGHNRYAVRAYRRALALAPGDPVCLHNLGHLLDVALGQPRRALAPLRQAARLLPDNPDVVASFAHALARAGQPVRARELMRTIVRRGASCEHHQLYCWIDEQVDRAIALHVPTGAVLTPARRAIKRRFTAG